MCAQTTFSNPVLRGSYPDPSICMVDDTFYLANSSFEYFPGLPIHRSTDLVNWELIGYALDRFDQVSGAVNLVDVQSDGGIHAPSIRYHNGTFYLITTNVYYDEQSGTTDFVNFVLTAKHAAGPWSDPHVIDGAPGIDPDLFFDTDGRVWYLGNQMPENPSFEGEGEIWLQELDPATWTLKGERSLLWRGACGGVWAEGPHLYSYDNRYYLMIAEGGTSFNHAVMIAVSDSIRGPYEGNERNPILTARHLSYDNWVNSTGHGDLVETADGHWYMVALGIRGEVNRASNMGRETFLVPVTWEQEPFEWKSRRTWWPVVSPLTGRLEREYPMPFAGTVQQSARVFEDNFTDEELNLEWNFRRPPEQGTVYSLLPNEGILRLLGGRAGLLNRGRSTVMGIRQTETEFRFESEFTLEATASGDEAGIMVVQKDNDYIQLGIQRSDEHFEVVVRRCQPGLPDTVLFRKPLNEGDVPKGLRITADQSGYSFYQLATGSDICLQLPVALPLDALLSKGYTGAYLAIYCHSVGRPDGCHADFSRVMRK